jgi:hypothetical protein
MYVLAILAGTIVTAIAANTMRRFSRKPVVEAAA